MKAGSGSRTQPRFKLRVSLGSGIPGFSAEAEVAGVKNSLRPAAPDAYFPNCLLKLLVQTKFCRRFLQSLQAGGVY